MKCASCGSKVDRNDIICQQCGAPITEKDDIHSPGSLEGYDFDRYHNQNNNNNYNNQSYQRQDYQPNSYNSPDYDPSSYNNRMNKLNTPEGRLSYVSVVVMVACIMLVGFPVVGTIGNIVALVNLVKVKKRCGISTSVYKIALAIAIVCLIFSLFSTLTVAGGVILSMFGEEIFSKFNF